MSLESLPAWLLPSWSALQSRRARLPHALLLNGPAGSGKRLFAEHLARSLLCTSPDQEGFACGTCPDCVWVESGNHPDYFTVIPAADQEADESAEAAEEGKKEKARSSLILIGQVRALLAALEVGAGGHAGGRRVVIVDPAEAMNVEASNAILKALEEPLGGTIYILVSHSPRRLLPTIRSRCQVIDFPRPARDKAIEWLRGQGISDDALLGFASGLPVRARELSAKPVRDARRQLAGELASLAQVDPLKLAADWEARIKAKAAAESGFTMPLLVGWIQRWLSDGVRVANGLKPRFYEDYEKDLQRLATGKAIAWLDAYRAVHAFRRSAQHPLSPRLFLEDMVLALRKTL